MFIKGRTLEKIKTAKSGSLLKQPAATREYVFAEWIEQELLLLAVFIGFFYRIFFIEVNVVGTFIFPPVKESFEIRKHFAVFYFVEKIYLMFFFFDAHVIEHLVPLMDAQRIE